jgi:hypothetical protein
MIMDGRSLKLLICAFFLKQIVSLIIFLYAIMVVNSSCCGARELNKLAALNVLVVLTLSSCHFDPNLNCFYHWQCIEQFVLTYNIKYAIWYNLYHYWFWHVSWRASMNVLVSWRIQFKKKTRQ